MPTILVAVSTLSSTVCRPYPAQPVRPTLKQSSNLRFGLLPLTFTFGILSIGDPSHCHSLPNFAFGVQASVRFELCPLSSTFSLSPSTLLISGCLNVPLWPCSTHR
ncbi:unnamed protein product [Nezara viridula]|uniref:Uncharacterized protein n=1 Tax=Nezara viridula TaxID=85310 RepID=A0A9P0HRG4_NEZVI|nr:unnamed protein product [Nezara viridula]